MGQFGIGIGIGIGIDSDEGPFGVFSHIPEGFEPIARGREAHPGLAWETKTTPEGLKHPQPSHPCRGTHSITTRLSPGACCARPGAIRSHPSGMPSRRRRRSGSGIHGTKQSPRAMKTSPPVARAAPNPSGSGSNHLLLFVFDSDADTDPDTDACGNGTRQDERGGDVPVAVPEPSSRR